MPVINIVVVLIGVGVLLWLVNRYVPMARAMKSFLNALVLVVVVVWVLRVVGLWHLITTR